MKNGLGRTHRTAPRFLEFYQHKTSIGEERKDPTPLSYCIFFFRFGTDFEADGRAQALLGRFASESHMRVASRFRRVSSFFALIAQNVDVRRYQGGWAWKKFQACWLARNWLSSSVLNAASLRCSYEYLRVWSLAPSNAFRPAGLMRPEPASFCTLAMLTALHWLLGLRGV